LYARLTHSVDADVGLAITVRTAQATCSNSGWWWSGETHRRGGRRRRRTGRGNTRQAHLVSEDNQTEAAHAAHTIQQKRVQEPTSTTDTVRSVVARLEHADLPSLTYAIHTDVGRAIRVHITSTPCPNTRRRRSRTRKRRRNRGGTGSWGGRSRIADAKAHSLTEDNN